MRKSVQYLLIAVATISTFLAAPASSFATIDLAIESARTEPVQGAADTAFTFAVTIKNRGNTQAKMSHGCFQYRLPTDPSYSFREVKNPTPNPYVLDPGKTVECKGQPQSNLPTGLLSIEFLVQNDISQTDTNNQNNRYVIQVPVASASGYIGQPQMYFDNKPILGNGSIEAAFGADVLVEVSMGNSGTVDALMPKGAVLWNVSEAGKVLAEDGRFDQNMVMQKGSKNITRMLKMPPLSPGNHNLVIALDPYNVIKEKNDVHAPVTLSINILVPDVYATIISLPSQPVTIRDTITMKVSVRVNGRVNAEFPVGTHFLYYGAKGFAVNKLILSTPVFIKPYGDEYNVSVTVPPFTNNPGAYDIEAWVDPVNTAHDYNLANNKVSSRVNVVLPSIKDIAPGSQPAGPQTMRPNTGTEPKFIPPQR